MRGVIVRDTILALSGIDSGTGLVRKSFARHYGLFDVIAGLAGKTVRYRTQEEQSAEKQASNANTMN
jgi:hypothetical protein